MKRRHALASAPEDETGFLAFLICRAAPQSELRYSAYFEALAHLGNALYAADPAAHARISAKMSDELRADLQKEKMRITRFTTASWKRRCSG